MVMVVSEYLLSIFVVVGVVLCACVRVCTLVSASMCVCVLNCP